MKNEKDPRSPTGDLSDLRSAPSLYLKRIRQRFLERFLKPKLSLTDMLLLTAYCGSFVFALLLTYMVLSSSLVSIFVASA